MLNQLVEHGNTVVVIEHNLDVIKTADYIIDLGPEGGDEGGYIVGCGTPEEIAEKGIIAVEGQELLTIPLESFLADKALWPADKDAEIVVYCGSGHRSTMAMTILLTEGYTNVTSLKGGFGSWTEAGLPVTEYAAQ